MSEIDKSIDVPDTASKFIKTNLQSKHMSQDNSVFQSQYKSQEDNPKAKRNYMIYLRDISSCNIEQNDQMRFLLYYTLEDKPQIETRLKTIIEIPFERNEALESIEFKLQVVYKEQEEQIICTQKIYLYQLGLTEKDGNTSGTYNIRFKADNPELEEYEFAMVFDASVVKTSMEGASIDESDGDGCVQIFTANIKKKFGFEKFEKKRKQDMQDNFIQNTGAITMRYRVDLQLLSQKYHIWLDDNEIDDVFFFYTTKEVKESKKVPMINLTFREVVTETIELEDYGNEGGIITKNTEIENNVIGTPHKQNIQEIFQQKPGQEQLSEVIFNYPIEGKFSIDFKFTLIENSSFHKKFLGFTAVKVLETRLFTTEFQPTHSEINLNSMDDDLPDQTWRLKCFESYLRNTDTLSTWDFKHNTVIKKNFRLTAENVDVVLDEVFLAGLFEKQYDPNQILNKIPLEQEEDFQILLKNYTRINEYEKILQENQNRNNLQFSQLQNHTFFKTVSPFDYITFKLFQDDKMIGYYEESFFKIPENQLVLGYLIKSQDGRIKSKFLEEGEVGGDLENEDEDMIIGTIKIVIDHIGYNDKILENDDWIYNLENLNTDDDQLVKIIKSGIQNFPVLNSKMFVFRLALDEIWNMVDFIAPCINNNAFELKLRMAKFCYVIRFKVEQIKARDFKDLEILSIFKQEKKCYMEKTADSLNFYVKSYDTIYKISTDLTTSQQLVFQLTSYMDYLIIELKTFPGNQTISFQTQQIKQCYFFSSNGFLLLPVKVPKKMPVKPKETVYELRNNDDEDDDDDDNQEENDSQEDSIQFDKQQKIPNIKQNRNGQSELFNSVIYFKFFFEFITTEEKDGEDEELLNVKGIYTVSLFQPPVITTRLQEKKLKNFIYELYIYDLDNFKKQKALSQRITYDSKLVKYTTELIQGAEFFRDGSEDIKNKSLRLQFILKRVFSDDPDEDDGDAPVIWDKKAFFNLKDFMLDENVQKEEDRSLKPLNIELIPNQFKYIPIKFYEDNINLEMELFLCINYRHNKFIEVPKSKLFFTITQEMKDYMVMDRVIEKSTTLKFKLISNSKEAQKDKKSLRSQFINCQNSKKNQSLSQEIMLQGFHVTDTLMVEIDNGSAMSETAIVKLNSLISMPLRKQMGKISPDDKEYLELDEEHQELEDKYDWCFININNRKLQFLVGQMSNENYDIMKGNKPLTESQGTISEQQISEKKSSKNASKISEKTVSSKQSIKKVQQEPQVSLLKKEIQRYKMLTQERMTLITKEKKELIKKQKWLEDLNNIIKRAQLQDDPDFNKKKKSQAMSSGIISEKKPKKKVELSEEAKQAKKLFQEQCVCAGDLDGTNNNQVSYVPVPGGFGFCAQCIKSIKEEYEKELESFQTEANQYEKTYLGNFNMENKIVKMKKKIINFQNKSAGIEIEEDNMEEKMMIDEINYIKKNIKIIDSECIMLQKDHERQVKEKKLLQADIEKKITQKDTKIQQVQHDCEVKMEQVELLKEKIAEKSNQLSKLKEQQA